MAILEVNHIRKSFDGTAVLKDISFCLEKGQVLSIIGSSGSGKTTLLRCLNFLETAESGTIRVEGKTLFDGEDQKRLSDGEIRRNRLHFGLVFQQFNLFPQYTVLENVMLAPRQLSGGQQQRVAIARALALEPDILCFDEPTSALDPELTGEVLRVIKGLKTADRTIIIVTHEMEFARSISDQVIFMADGVIEEEGTPEQVFGNPKSAKTRQFLSSSLERI